MKVAVLLCAYAGCSFREAKRSMEVFNFVFPFLGLDIPSHVTIREWLLKAGLAELRHKKKAIEDYAVIMDESITIAEHKLLMTLAVPARQGGHPLACSDAEVVDIHVAGSHKGKDILEAIKRTTEALGKVPSYAVTDNGRHFALTDVDYLMPSNMRAIARWMNVFDWARWAKNMIEAEHKLRPKERRMYAFLWEHGAMVEELNEVMNCFRKVLGLCKDKGLSKQSVMECDAIIHQELMGRGTRLTRLAEMMIRYFFEEASLLKDENDVHHISSDLIESMFGYFKQRKSPNRMHGVTGFILVLPLRGRLSTLETARTFDFKSSLEHNRIADVKAWERKTLPENLAAKRGRILNQAS